MEAQYVIEKFTRCPRCRSFSLKQLQGGETGGITGIFSGSPFVCNNCGTQFLLKGNNLKEISGELHQHNQENKEETREKEPVRIESRTFSRAAIFLVFFLCLIIGGIILVLHPWNQHQGQIEALQFNEQESTAPFESEQKVNPNEEKKVSLVKTVIPEAEEVNDEMQEFEPVQISQITHEPETSTIEKVRLAKEDIQTKELSNVSNTGGPISVKIFDVSGMKVRSSSPHRSDRSFRWYFKRKTVTIKRSEMQRVYIAGDPSGKAKWAVDDEIIVNGEKIKGISNEMAQPGYIPHSKRLPPCDITHLVSAGRNTVLDIRLVDYGVLWGNTSLYLVIM